MFVKALFLHHFDLKRYIQIEMNKLDYAISRVLSLLTLDNLGRWYPVVFFFHKMIPMKTKYKMHNDELLAIIVTFKTWK